MWLAPLPIFESNSELDPCGIIFFTERGLGRREGKNEEGGGGAERRLPKPKPCGLLVSPSGHVMGPGVRWGDFAARKSLRGPRRGLDAKNMAASSSDGSVQPSPFELFQVL